MALADSTLAILMFASSSLAKIGLVYELNFVVSAHEADPAKFKCLSA